MFRNGCPGGILGIGESTAGPTKLRISDGAGSRQPLWPPIALLVQVTRASFQVTVVVCGAISQISPVSLSNTASSWKSDKIRKRSAAGCASCQFLIISAMSASFWTVGPVSNWEPTRTSPTTRIIRKTLTADFGSLVFVWGCRGCSVAMRHMLRYGVWRINDDSLSRDRPRVPIHRTRKCRSS